MKIYIKRKSVIYVFIMVLALCISNIRAISQEMPPKPVTVSLIQNLGFGAFSPGLSGGSVIVLANGVRFSTGSVILVSQGYLYFPAIFLLEGNPGTIVHLLNGPSATLTGSNGGTMTLELGAAIPGDPIIINAAPQGAMQIRIGGNLVVGNQVANPAGFYNGLFSLMFIQE